MLVIDCTKRIRFGPLRPRGRMRLAILSALLAAICCVDRAAAATPDGTPLQFQDESHALNSELRVYRREHGGLEYIDYVWLHDHPLSRENWQIARARVLGHEASGKPLRFRVEAQPDKSDYELCYCPMDPGTKQCRNRGRICREVGIDITQRSGVLYPVVSEGAPWTVSHHFRDFAPQRVELSVAEGDHKVFREVLIEPPAGIPDCGEYPDTDTDRYACLFLGEIMGPAPTPNQALLDALPDKLVQPKANYELVFAEEFDGNTGRYPASDCAGGLSNLDGDKWNFYDNWCKAADLTGKTCQDMRHGYYEMSTFHGCASGINTAGKFTYKYGYVETRYTVNLAHSRPQNMNLVIGDPSRSQRYAAARYGVPLGNYEEMSKALPIEINVFEYFPERKRELTNYFYNYNPYVFHPHTEPRYASNWTRFCYTGTLTGLNYFTAEQCARRESLTVTKGLEWTPRGYRMLVKVQDLHDDFIVVSKRDTRTSRVRAQSSSIPTDYGGGLASFTGAERDAFFEFLQPGNADSVLMNFAVGHAPMQLDFGTWRGFGNEQGPEQNRVTVRMRIEYVRVFQPRDRYVDMEPVYE